MKTFKINLNDAATPFTLDAAKLVEGRCLIQGLLENGPGQLQLTAHVVEAMS